MSRANSDIQQVNHVVVLIPLTAASAFILVGVVVIMMLQSVTLALFALGALPLLNIAATRFSHRIAPVSLELQQELGDLSGVVEESVAGVRVVKGFGAERMQEARLDAEADSVLDRALAAAKLRANFLPLVDFLPALALVIILWYGGHLVLDGQLQIGDLVAFNSFILMLIWPLRMAGMLVAQAARSTAAAGRIYEILSTETIVADPARPVPMAPAGRGEIHFDGVRFAYGNGPAVLDGFDLTVTGGEAIAVVGPTGSGKTTIARLLPRFYDVDAGRVLIDGVDVRDVKLTDLRRSIGIVFEDTFLFSDSVRENIAFADPKAPMDAVRRAAQLAGAAGFIEALPDGLRDRHRRARLLALGRPATTDRDRASGARRAPGADPRRRHLVGRPDERARDPRRAQGSDARPDDAHHCPPGRDDRAGRSRRAAAKTAASRPKARTTSCSRRTSTTGPSSPSRTRSRAPIRSRP